MIRINKAHSNGKLPHRLLPQRPKSVKLATKVEGVNLATKATATKAESVNLVTKATATKAIVTKAESVNLPQRLNTMTPLYILYDVCLNDIRNHSPKKQVTGDYQKLVIIIIYFYFPLIFIN